MRETPFLLHAPLTSAPSRVASLDRGPCRRQLVKALSMVELDHGAVVPSRNNGDRTGLGEPRGPTLPLKLPTQKP